MLAAAADPERGFDAIVVGEYERAFHGDQLANLAPVRAAHGVQVSHTTALGEALRSTADGDDRETTRSPFTAE